MFLVCLYAKFLCLRWYLHGRWYWKATSKGGFLEASYFSFFFLLLFLLVSFLCLVFRFFLFGGFFDGVLVWGVFGIVGIFQVFCLVLFVCFFFFCLINGTDLTWTFKLEFFLHFNSIMVFYSLILFLHLCSSGSLFVYKHTCSIKTLEQITFRHLC